MTRRPSLVAVAAATALALIALPLAAQDPGPSFSGDLRGSDVTGGAGARDNTRVQGIVFDSEGNRMGKVDIWVMNDEAPADRLRSRTRDDGDFLIRNVGRLYTQTDVYGINFRLLFEAPGFTSTELIVPVEKNGHGEVFPILWKEGSEATDEQGSRIVVRGKVANHKGKGIKEATVSVVGPDGAQIESFTTKKDGEYRFILWNSPSVITVTANVGGQEQERNLDLTGSMRPDVVGVAEESFAF